MTEGKRLQPLVSDGQELLKFFGDKLRIYQEGVTQEAELVNAMCSGIMVTAAVRLDVLTSVYQGRVNLAGLYYDIKFVDLGDGVWIANIPTFAVTSQIRRGGRNE